MKASSHASISCPSSFSSCPSFSSRRQTTCVVVVSALLLEIPAKSRLRHEEEQEHARMKKRMFDIM